jgi:diaminohydroxyphosphoribosylaminopyrimidine deaminase/5-amino-6-(5-phosphoribosylamino)uracil reductase
VEAIIAAGVRKVMVGVRDPAQHVAGKGISMLRRRGITVVEGVLGERCSEVHEHYLHHERTGIPFVTLKVAMSLDGRIATAEGDSRWITGEPARREGHRLRARHHAIAVGAQTVLADDPRLDVRLTRGTNPVPIVFDSRLTVVSKAKTRPEILRAGTLVLHLGSVSKRLRTRLAATGAQGIDCEADAGGHIDVAAALSVLGRRSIRSLLVEGGGHLHASFVRTGLWQRLIVFQAPIFLGDGRPFLPDLRWPRVADALAPTVQSRRFLGRDLMMILAPAVETKRPRARS